MFPSHNTRRPPGADWVVALLGNPNVGKSTLFNHLTGMRQHTGNWAGKTVGSAAGRLEWRGEAYTVIDLPGAYSLSARSPEEEIARDFLLSRQPDAVVVVCDATCLERNLNLVLQTLELTKKVVVCVNLMDEAARHGVTIDLAALSARLGVPAVGVMARKRVGLDALMEQIAAVSAAPAPPSPPPVRYGLPVEEALGLLLPAVSVRAAASGLPPRWIALRLLESDAPLPVPPGIRATAASEETLRRRLTEAHAYLAKQGFAGERLRDQIASAPVRAAEAICRDALRRSLPPYSPRDRRLDRILTSKGAGFPLMLLLLALVLWITLSGANYPGEWIALVLFRMEAWLAALCQNLNAPPLLWEPLVFGVYRVAAWVVSVMLPPMAVFFPLFTLLEDLGYLPRVAYNLDRSFRACKACGKQALTMCMG